MEWRGEESENAIHLGKRLGLGGSLSLVPRGSGVTCWGWEGAEASTRVQSFENHSCIEEYREKGEGSHRVV